MFHHLNWLTVIEVAENLDYLKIPEGTLIDTEEMKKRLDVVNLSFAAD